MTSEWALRLQHSLLVSTESDRKARAVLGWERLPCSKLIQMPTRATAANHFRKCLGKASDGVHEWGTEGRVSVIDICMVLFCRSHWMGNLGTVRGAWVTYRRCAANIYTCGHKGTILSTRSAKLPVKGTGMLVLQQSQQPGQSDGHVEVWESCQTSQRRSSKSSV